MDEKTTLPQIPAAVERAISKALNPPQEKTTNAYDDLAADTKKRADELVKYAERRRDLAHKHADDLVAAGVKMEEILTKAEASLKEAFDHLEEGKRKFHCAVADRDPFQDRKS